MHPDWNIKFLLLEPGGIRTEYAATSLTKSVRHPAYTGPELPTSQLLSYLSNPDVMTTWGDAAHVAQILFHTVSHKGDRPLPMRLAMGSDSYGLIMAETEAVVKELTEWKSESQSISSADQLDSIEFLQK